MLNGPGDNRNGEDPWFNRWEKVIRLPFRRYDLPGGNVGRKFIDSLSKEVELVADQKGCSERMIVFQVIILQKEILVKKTADIRRVIQRRLQLWDEGQFDVLMQEAMRCSETFLKRYRKENRQGAHDHTVKVFHRLMLQGKLRSAVRWITERDQHGLLQPTDLTKIKDASGVEVDMPVIDALRTKHPEPGVTTSDACKPYPDLPSMIDLDITGAHILSVAHRIQGGAGPGGSDAAAWQDWLIRYGAHSQSLRDSVARLARSIANTTIQWECIQALMANRLVALDKCPGIRPIGIGECLRRVVGKAVMMAAGDDVKKVCGPDQLCSGIEAGIEGAIHSMYQLFEENKGTGWGVLLVDASNAFNSLNRKAALWHARHLWPRGCRFLFNTYKGWSSLVLGGSQLEMLYSKEGTTQGDPLSMAFYALGVLPLISNLKDLQKWIQMWYADDASSGGTLPMLREWFGDLMAMGPAFGYFPEPTKSVLVVDEADVPAAKDLFGDIGVHVTTSHRLLGGHIGSDEGKEQYVRQKVEFWAESVTRLGDLAIKQPQDAYAALTKSLAFEWLFLQRVVPNCGPQFAPLEEAIAEKFLPKLFGVEVSIQDRGLYELPIRFAGLGIPNPVITADAAHQTSRKCAEYLATSIRNQATSFDVGAHRACVQVNRQEARSERQKELQGDFTSLADKLPAEKRRTVRRAMDNPTGAWLTVKPSARNDTALSPREFRDGLAMRYGKPLIHLPSTCDGCGSKFSVDHGLNCPNGGNVIQRHNELRDAVGQLASLAYPHVTKEPIVREGDGKEDGLVCDLAVRGVWNPQTEALFDFRVVNTDAQSYVSRSVAAVLESTAKAKKAKHRQACVERRADFTPFICSTDGVVHREGEHFLKRLAARLSGKWQKPYSEVMTFVRVRISLSMLRATVHCVRGSRKKLRALYFEDGAVMPLLTV